MNSTSRRFAAVVSAAAFVGLVQFCDAECERPFGAGTSVLSPRVKRLQDRALDHDVMPAPKKEDRELIKLSVRGLFVFDGSYLFHFGDRI